MKIIQTYWSAPAKQNNPDDLNGRNNGGWTSEKYHAYSWALSSLKFKQLYPELILYTDKTGYDWLINKLNLDYSNVICNLDYLNSYNPLLWALPKVFVYGQQNEPFIHVDGDVFIWKKLDKSFENNQLIVQNFEDNFSYYATVLEQIKDQFTYINPLLMDNINKKSPIIAINAGIIGGQDYSFFKEYSAMAMELVEKNTHQISNINIGMFNTIFEQLVFFLLAKHKDIPITPLFENIDENFAQFLRFSDVPLLTNYIHTIGISKKKEFIFQELEARLKYEFPKVYKHINNIYSEKTISIGLKIKPLELDKIYDYKELPNTKTVLNSLAIPANDWKANQISNFMDELLEHEEESEAYTLASDMYQIEQSHSDLVLKQKGVQTPPIENIIEERLKIVYKNDKDSFINLKFKVNNEFCKIIYLHHEFGEEITSNYLQNVSNKKIQLQKNETPQLVLVKWDENDIKYKPLKDWDLLLYYFDDLEVSGKQIIDLIDSGKTPFEYDDTNIKEDILNFLVKNSLYYNHLKILSQ
jgi:hypothetical protein